MTGRGADPLRLSGARYAAAVRLITLVPIVVIALMRAAPERFWGMAAVITAVAAWTCCYAWLLTRGPRSSAAVVDAFVLAGAGLSMLWTDALADTNVGWIRLLVAFACVTNQWHTTPFVGALTTLVAAGGPIAALTLSDARWSLVTQQVWVLMLALVSRAAWSLARRAAAQARRLSGEAEAARREAEVAAAVRAEERDHADRLHDTAAASLLMVGAGRVGRGDAWLRARAARDLELLRSAGEPRHEEADLVEWLRTDLEVTHLAVTFDAPDSLRLPSPVATAFADAAREALNNVRRHAGTDRVHVRLHAPSGGVRLDIADDGRGFDPGAVTATRRGVRESIHARLERAGGTAIVTSEPGSGTRVSLRWSADDG